MNYMITNKRVRPRTEKFKLVLLSHFPTFPSHQSYMPVPYHNNSLPHRTSSLTY